MILPSEVFASGREEEEGLLNLAAPVAGPRPDWDPDIVAALDEALDLDDPDNILADDFILKVCLQIKIDEIVVKCEHGFYLSFPQANGSFEEDR